MNKIPTFAPIVKDLHKNKMTVTIEMDKRTLSTALRRTSEYKSLPEKLRPGLEGIANYARGSMIPYTFDREGPGWKPLSKRSVREREAAGFGGQHPILIRTRDLFKELTEKSHPRHIEVIKVGRRARIEIGGSSKKFLENQLGKTSQRLPARPMIPGTGNIPIKERDRKEMLNIIERAYQRALTKPT